MKKTKIRVSVWLRTGNSQPELVTVVGEVSMWKSGIPDQQTPLAHWESLNIVSNRIVSWYLHGSLIADVRLEVFVLKMFVGSSPSLNMLLKPWNSMKSTNVFTTIVQCDETLHFEYSRKKSRLGVRIVELQAL